MYPSTPTRQAPVITRTFDQSRALEIADAYEEARELRQGRLVARTAAVGATIIAMVLGLGLASVSNDLSKAYKERNEARAALRPRPVVPPMQITAAPLPRARNAQ